MSTKPNTLTFKLIRVRTYTYGRKTITFWHGGGYAFTGQGCHMRAFKAAREYAEAHQ